MAIFTYASILTRYQPVMIKILTFSTLFPNAVNPSHGVFVETRLRHLVASGEISARVLAPVPWFPSIHPFFGKYALFAQAPIAEIRCGLQVDHPRYFLPPKFGMTPAPLLLALSAKRSIQRMLAAGEEFDLIDAHYFYPDGVAALLLGYWFNKPVVITARGTDISLLPFYTLPRKMILWAARHAAGMITVCQALKVAMVKLGVPAERIIALRNGVDLQLFQPCDRAAERAKLNLSRRTLLSVGHLIPRKSNDLIIRALALLPETDLLIAGVGPELSMLSAIATEVGVTDRVRFVGALSQAELRRYYGAADALVLASSREGWANVLLEAMACGTPVVASNVWGTPEVVACAEAGVLMPSRTPEGVAAGVNALFENYPEHAATRGYAEQFSWSDTTAGQINLFRKILERTKQ
jgi:teichuronic acid biosynthesis glycosyltransferase TuaC